MGDDDDTEAGLDWLGGVRPQRVVLRIGGQEVSGHVATRHPRTFVGPRLVHRVRHRWDAFMIAGRLGRTAVADIEIGSTRFTDVDVYYVPSLSADAVLGLELVERIAAT